MTPFPYELEADDRPKLGLIVLQSDETIEDDFRQLFDPAHVRLHISRIRSGIELSPAMIRDMEAALPAAADLFPKGVSFDAVGYACTSGSSLIGPDRVTDLVQSACRTPVVTNPLTATFRRLRDSNASRIAILSPYPADIAAQMRSDFEAAGFVVPRAGSFGEAIEANVARITQSSIMQAARSIAGAGDIDAVFLSCTNLRALAATRLLRDELGIPVLCSNASLAWDMARAARLEIPQV